MKNRSIRTKRDVDDELLKRKKLDKKKVLSIRKKRKQKEVERDS